VELPQHQQVRYQLAPRNESDTHSDAHAHKHWQNNSMAEQQHLTQVYHSAAQNNTHNSTTKQHTTADKLQTSEVHCISPCQHICRKIPQTSSG
jgi:hypothetical protein